MDGEGWEGEEGVDGEEGGKVVSVGRVGKGGQVRTQGGWTVKARWSGGQLGQEDIFSGSLSLPSEDLACVPGPSFLETCHAHQQTCQPLTPSLELLPMS